ncbi:MAG: hypothetical protein HQL21_04440 [Candidatus Omnitrophica bacterium]|nr:hypothetical protein [Candidatus Omnitrophota bacterium]
MEQKKISDQNSWTKNMLRAKKAQMALVFLVLILIGLFFLGIVANWNKMATSRTQVTLASNLGTSALTSYVGSYAQAKMDKHLEGKRQLCKKTSWLWDVTMGLAIATFASLSSFWGVVTVAAMAAAVSATAVQGVSVPPGVSAIWSVLPGKDMSEEDRFTEAGIGAALPLAVADTVQMKDDHDFMMNGPQVDNIPRFAYLYSMRVWNRKGLGGASSECTEFFALQKALKTGLAKDLGLIERKCKPPSVGDPCCVPLEFRDMNNCPKDEEQAAKCQPLLIDKQEWNYDDGYCEGGKAGTFLNFIGVDDTTTKYKMTAENTLGSPQVDDPLGKYSGRDSVSSDPAKVFALLWTLHDSVIDIHEIKNVKELEPECHWADTIELRKQNAEQKDCQQDPPENRLYKKEDTSGVLFKKAEGTLTGCIQNWPKTCYVSYPDTDDILDKVKTVEPFLKKPEPTGCPQDPGQVYGLDYNSIMNCASKIKGNKALQKLTAVWRRGWDADGKDWPSWADWGNVNQSATCWNELVPADDKEPFASASAKGDTFICNPVLDDKLLLNSCKCPELAINPDKWDTDTFDEMAMHLRTMIREMAWVLDAKQCKQVDQVLAWSQAVGWVTHLRKMSCDLRAYREIYDLWLKENYSGGDETWCLSKERPKDMDDPEWTAIEDSVTYEWGDLDSTMACLEFQKDNQHLWAGCKSNCKKVIPDPTDCAKKSSWPDDKDDNGCGVCMDQSARVGKDCFKKCFYEKVPHSKPKRFVYVGEEEKCRPLLAEVYDTPRRGCRITWAPNKGPEEQKCRDLPRSFYAHETDNDGQTMEDNFDADTCCNTVKMKPPFANMRYEHIEEEDDVPSEDKCDHWYETVKKTDKEPECPPEHSSKRLKTTRWKKKSGGEEKYCNMCMKEWDENKDESKLKDPSGNILKKPEDTLVNISDMFQAMMINRCDQRYKYLEEAQKKIKKALDPLNEMANKIDTAVAAFEPYVQKLCEVIKTDKGPEKAYYVWRNPCQGPKSDPTWHAIMVEAAIPSRCNGACFTDKLPYVTKPGEYGGKKQCALLKSSRGIVSIKVSRYDEERDPFSVVNNAIKAPFNSPLRQCGTDKCPDKDAHPEKEAFIGCENCGSFSGKLEGQCKTAVETVISQSGHSVKTEGEYWVTRDPDRKGRSMANIKIRQVPK